MYGSTDKSMPQRWLIFILQCVFLLFVYWFLFLNGNEFFQLSIGDSTRRVLLFVFCIVTFLRMSYMVFFLLRRGVTWGEALNVPFAFALYYIGFSMLGGIINIPVDGIDYFAMFIFLAGSVINSWSEMLRDSYRLLYSACSPFITFRFMTGICGKSMESHSKITRERRRSLFLSFINL